QMVHQHDQSDCNMTFCCDVRVLFSVSCFLFFFFNATATSVISTLSLHDALPIYETTIGRALVVERIVGNRGECGLEAAQPFHRGDRKSTRLNSSHRTISYAVFCLKKKTNTDNHDAVTRNPPRLQTRTCLVAVSPI